MELRVKVIFCYVSSVRIVQQSHYVLRKTILSFNLLRPRLSHIEDS